MVLAYAVSSRIQRRGRGWPSQTPASSTTAAAIARGTVGVSNSIRGTCCLMIVLRFRDPCGTGNVAFERGANQVPAGRKKTAHGFNRGREYKTRKPRTGGRKGVNECLFSFVPAGLYWL